MEQFKTQENEKTHPHLNSGVQPIMACLDSAGSGSRHPHLSENIEEVSLYSDSKKVTKEGFIKGNKISYIISPIDTKDKFSFDYRNCTGIVIVGNDVSTDENISFMTHQNPGYIFHGEQENFSRDLNKRLAEIKQRCKSGTIDIAIFGGQFLKMKEFDEDHKVQEFLKGEYNAILKLLSEEIEKEFGFSPTVITGPKFAAGDDIVAFDTTNRRLYILRKVEDLDPKFTPHFNAKNIDEESKTWKPGEITKDEYLKRSEPEM